MSFIYVTIWPKELTSRTTMYFIGTTFARKWYKAAFKISLGRKGCVFYISQSGKGNIFSYLCVRWLYNCSLSFYVVINVEALNAHLNLWLVPGSSLALEQARQIGEVTPVGLLFDILLGFAVGVAYSSPSHCIWMYPLATQQGLSVRWNALICVSGDDLFGLCRPQTGHT